jgi:hypothetical protein
MVIKRKMMYADANARPGGGLAGVMARDGAPEKPSKVGGFEVISASEQRETKPERNT